MKSTPEEIRARFDGDVERFSNLETKSWKLRAAVPSIGEMTLIDHSRPMLDWTVERPAGARVRNLDPVEGSIRNVPPPEPWADAAVAASVFHHLRADAKWLAVFANARRSLRPGGWLWISDLVPHAHPGIQAGMWSRYGGYLAELKGPEYRNHVFAYIEKEDSPRPLQWQCDALRQAGFEEIEILGKNNCFAAWGARR